MAPLRSGGLPGTLRNRTYEIIFEHDTRAGKIFDVLLIGAILASVAVVMAESVAPVRSAYGPQLRILEWAFTLLFTAEYAARLWSVDRAGAYARSFLGLIDLFAVIPTYLSLIAPGGQVLVVIRVLRVVRVFRVLKLAHYVGEARILAAALRASRYKITVFLISVVSIVVVVGALMYLVEGPESGFTSIPRGMYWSIVTLTTVGYGDIAPRTPAGQILAALVMIMGYGIIAVPTGIVTVELGRHAGASSPGLRCAACGHRESDARSSYCRYCGRPLSPEAA